MKIHFNGCEKPTIGVEVELQIIDPETKDLVSGAPEILKSMPDSHGHVKPELIQSTIELNTGICADVSEVRKDLSAKLKDLLMVCDKLGYELASAGTHPFSKWPDQKITPEERYYKLVDRCQWPARRLMIFGLHVHIGVATGEKAIAVFNALSNYLPHLLSISASSPFFDGRDTGLASTRVKIFETLPTAGLPYRMLNWAEFQRFMITLVNAKAIASIREVWWDLRPHPDFGTIELRVCDGLPSIDNIVAVAALIQALVVWLGTKYDEGEYLPVHRYWILRENKWRAARWATDAEIIIDEEGNLTPMDEEIMQLISNLSPVAKELGSYEELLSINEILKDGPSFKRQRAVFDETGDHRTVIENLVHELRDGIMSAEGKA